MFQKIAVNLKTAQTRRMRRQGVNFIKITAEAPPKINQIANLRFRCDTRA